MRLPVPVQKTAIVKQKFVSGILWVEFNICYRSVIFFCQNCIYYPWRILFFYFLSNIQYLSTYSVKSIFLPSKPTWRKNMLEKDFMDKPDNGRRFLDAGILQNRIMLGVTCTFWVWTRLGQALLANKRRAVLQPLERYTDNTPFPAVTWVFSNIRAWGWNLLKQGWV